MFVPTPLDGAVIVGLEWDWVDLRRAIASQSACAVLESGVGFGSQGRWSILGAFPRAIFSITDGRWRLSDDWPDSRPNPTLDPLTALRFLLRRTSGRLESPFPFHGGWIGFIGYDIAPLLERLPRRIGRSGTLPDLHLAYFDTFALRDRHSDQSWLVAVDRFDEGDQAVFERVRHWKAAIRAAMAGVGDLYLDDDTTPLIDSPLRADMDQEQYRRGIQRILDYLRAGDVFQVNFTHRFRADWVGDVAALFERSLRLAPAPFAALIRDEEWSIVSTSPERFWRIDANGGIQTRPIKGTRPRGMTDDEDRRLRQELLQSEKDRAELTMIVDLERNDLGKICRFGSIAVREHAVLETFSHVHHLVSTVEGQLHPEFNCAEVMRALFPGGSITGAPKIRAMQIIDELESTRRGVYTGGIGYFSDDGQSDFNISIRTIIVDQQVVHFHVGGGIVIDSDPRAEYDETLAKAAGMQRILRGNR